MANARPVREHLTAVPMLGSIAVTALVMALVIVWQLTGLPVVVLLLVPWLVVMVALMMPVRSDDQASAMVPPSGRRLVAAAGMAPVALIATIATANVWASFDHVTQASPASTRPVADEVGCEIDLSASETDLR